MCKLIAYVVPVGPPYSATGEMKAITKCEEHFWTFEGPAMVDMLCPIGRIEKAVEDGVAKIVATIEQKLPLR